MSLTGKRTYICAVLGGLVVALRILELIDGPTAEALLGLLGFGGLAALRAAVGKGG